MKNQKTLYTNYIFFPALLLFTISFPFPIAFNSILIPVLFLVYLFRFKELGSNFKSYIKNRLNILLLILFLCLLISFIYSDDINQAKQGILVAIPIVSLPLSLSGINCMTTQQTNILKKSFITACFIASLYYFLKALVYSGFFSGIYTPQAFTKDSFSYYSYYLTYFKLSTSIHPIFFSLYLAASIFLIIFNFTKNSILISFLKSLLVLYFIFYLILLTSITINFCFYSFTICYLFYKFSFKKWSHILLFLSLILIGSAVTSYLFIIKYTWPTGDGTYRFDSTTINRSYLFIISIAEVTGLLAIVIKLFVRNKVALTIIGFTILATALIFIYLKGTAIDRNNQDWTVNSITARVDYGSEAIEIIKKSPLFGVGIGDNKIGLMSNRAVLPPNMDPEQKFNPHNQFLDFWIIAGIIPLFCFIIFFITAFSRALKYQHIAYIGLLYCFLLFCFTDIPMMIQKGQLFFLFFVCLFENEILKKEIVN